jgi:hypothetical protein
MALSTAFRCSGITSCCFLMASKPGHPEGLISWEFSGISLGFYNVYEIWEQKAWD